MRREDAGSDRFAATLVAFGAAARATAQTGPSMEIYGFGMADAELG